MWYLIVSVAAFVAGLIVGILFGRKNQKTVESAVEISKKLTGSNQSQ